MSTNDNVNLKPAYIRKLLKNPPDVMDGFHYEDLADFLEIGIKENYAANDVIIRKSDYVNSAYLICEGDVSVWEDNIELTVLHERDFLGETFLFSESKRLAKIVAANDCTLLRFQRHDMLLFFKKKPAKLFNIFTRNVIYVQQKKITAMNEHLLGVKKKLLQYEK